jgi:inner membrane protein
MALPLVHAAAGYLVYEALRPAGSHRLGCLAVAVGMANAPDLDFVPGLLIGHPDAFHRGFTHTLGAVLVAAAVAAGLLRLLGRPGRQVRSAALLVAVAWASHLAVDFVTADVVAPHGARFLWPLSGAYYIAPVTLLSEVVIDRSGPTPFLHSLFAFRTLGVWTEELALLVCALALVPAMRAVRGALAAPAGHMAEEP